MLRPLPQARAAKAIIRDIAGTTRYAVRRVAILFEFREEDAKRAVALLEEAMTLAFREVFPGAPLTGLVSVHSGHS